MGIQLEDGVAKKSWKLSKHVVIVLGVLCVRQALRKKDENEENKQLKVCNVLPLCFVPVFLAVDNEWCYVYLLH